MQVIFFPVNAVYFFKKLGSPKLHSYQRVLTHWDTNMRSYHGICAPSSTVRYYYNATFQFIYDMNCEWNVSGEINHWVWVWLKSVLQLPCEVNHGSNGYTVIIWLYIIILITLSQLLLMKEGCVLQKWHVLQHWFIQWRHMSIMTPPINQPLECLFKKLFKQISGDHGFP